MPPISASTVARKFRWLWPSERRDFLASLWEARGFDTHIDEGAGTVVAEREGETVEIGIVGPLALSPPDADVLVATRTVGRAESVANSMGAELLTPADLREQLLYGVDRDVGSRLAREYLDAELTVAPREADGGLDRSRLVVLVAVVVAVGAVIAISGVGGPFAGEEADSFPTPEPAAPGATESSNTATATESNSVLGAYPPGLNGSGVQNASELAATHRAEVEGRQRRVEVRYRGPANTTTLPDVVDHTVTANVHSPGWFNSTFQVREVEHGSATDRTLRYWADGTRRHRLVETENDTSYSRSPLSGRSIVVAVESFVNRIYTGALAANTTRVTTVHQSGVTVHRITAMEEPEGYRDELTAFRAVALITNEGRLIRLDVEYTHVPTGEQVEIEVRYSKLDDVSPPPRPEWVARNEHETETDTETETENGTENGTGT